MIKMVLLLGILHSVEMGTKGVNGEEAMDSTVPIGGSIATPLGFKTFQATSEPAALESALMFLEDPTNTLRSDDALEQLSRFQDLGEKRCQFRTDEKRILVCLCVESRRLVF